MVGHLRGLVPVNRSSKRDVPSVLGEPERTHKQYFALTPISILPVSGGIVHVIGKKIVIQLPEDVQSDPPVGRKHVVICLPEHAVEVVQCQPFAEQLVAQPVHLNVQIQLSLLMLKFKRSITCRRPSSSMTPVMSPASNLLMAKSSDFCMSALIL